MTASYLWGEARERKKTLFLKSGRNATQCAGHSRRNIEFNRRLRNFVMAQGCVSLSLTWNMPTPPQRPRWPTQNGSPVELRCTTEIWLVSSSRRLRLWEQAHPTVAQDSDEGAFFFGLASCLNPSYALASEPEPVRDQGQNDLTNGLTSFL